MSVQFSSTTCKPIKYDVCGKRFINNNKYINKHSSLYSKELDNPIALDLGFLKCAVVQVITSLSPSKYHYFSYRLCWIDLEIKKTKGPENKYQYLTSGYLPQYNV